MVFKFNLGLYQRSIFHDLKILMPFCFLFGAGLETFMIKTGFYDIVVRKESKRKYEANMEFEKARERLKEKLEKKK
eukprot:gene12639-6543_t